MGEWDNKDNDKYGSQGWGIDRDAAASSSYGKKASDGDYDAYGKAGQAYGQYGQSYGGYGSGYGHGKGYGGSSQGYAGAAYAGYGADKHDIAFSPEGALTLDLFTPQSPGAAPLPVVVFLF